MPRTARHPSIQKRVPRVFIALLLLFAVASFASAFYEVRRHALAKAGARLEGVTEIVAGLLERSATRTALSGVQLAARPQLKDYLVSRSPAAQSRAQVMLDSLARPGPATLGAELWDAEGVPVLASGTNGTFMNPETFRALASQMTSADTGYLGPLTARAGSDSVYFPVLAPVTDSTGVLGYIVVHRRLTGSSQDMATIRELIGDDVALHLGSSSTNVWSDLSSRVSGPPVAIPAAGKRELQYDRDSASVLASAKAIPYTSWIALLEFPRPVLLAGTEPLLRNFALVTGILLVLGGFAAWMLSRDITRPVAELAEGADAMARGDYSRRIVVRRDDELGELGRAFNTMAASVDAAVGQMSAEIVQRRRIEDALRRSEARFRRVVDSNMQGILFWGADGEITEANDQFLRMAGYTRDDLRAGRISWKRMTPAEWEQADRRALESVAAVGTCSPYEKEYIRKDGTRLPVLQGAAALNGDENHGVAFVLDISDRKRAEAARRVADERVRAIIETSPVAIASLDLEGRVTLWNRAAAQLFGWSDAEVMGGPLPAMNEDERREFDDLRQRAVQGEVLKGLETRRQRRDGARIDLRLFIAATYDAAGRANGVTSVFEDISSGRKLEEQLRQSQKMEAVGRLAGGVAHDFNNLLTVVLGASDMLLLDLPGGDPRRGPVVEIREAGERAAALTNQLLAFSRKQFAEPRVFSLNQLVSDVEKMMRRLLGEDVALTVRLDQALGAIEADRGHIEQVLINLAVNARDAMPRGGSLIIETANVALDEEYAGTHSGVRPGEYVMLAVSDTGTGMSEDTKAHIFEPFFTTKEAGKGTGLGLATCYGIVKQAGGHISVYSELGVGTTMKVYLPRVVQDRPVPAEAQAAVQGGGETILLVEDDHAVRNIAVRMLSALGYHVISAVNGHAALEELRARAQDIHLLLSDVVLPGIGGRQIAEEARRINPLIKVLFVSGYTDDVILHNQLLEHDVAFLQKPFTPQTLGRKVREVLDSPQLNQDAPTQR